MKLLQKILKSFKKIHAVAIIGLVALFAFLLLLVFIKGDRGNPISYQTNKDKSLTGPFEAPNSDSRYALTESIVENHSVLFTHDLAEFALPDLVTYQGKYFSIFTPGISFIGIPFYIFGKQFGLPQLFSYLSVTLFAFINMFLIARISYKLGANLYASLLAGFIFLFGTNELTYGFSYAQHATSVSFLLMSFLLVLGKRSVIKNMLFGIFAGISLLLDIPNLVLLLPMGLYLLVQHIGVEKQKKGTKISFNITVLTVLFGIIPFVALMGWYNLQTTGSYTKLPQTEGQTQSLDPKKQAKNQLKIQSQNQSEQNIKIFPFVSEVQIQGFYTLLVSEERSIPIYNPVVLLGILGIIYLYKRRQQIIAANIIAGTILINIILYSLFGDPWGGWSFGARYLIPACAMLSIGLAIAINTYKKRLWFVILFAATACYSLFINIIGVLTTSLIPSKHDALNTHPQLPYTYIYNIDLINENKLGSLFYNLFFSNIASWIFVGIVVDLAIIITMILYFLSYKYEGRKGENI